MKVEAIGSILTSAAKTFLRNVRQFQGDDRDTLDLSLQSYDHLGSGGSEPKLRTVLDYLERLLLKGKKVFSNGALFSLCVISFISRGFAENYQIRTALSLLEDGSSPRLRELLAKKRESALIALFHLIRLWDRKVTNPLKAVYDISEVEATDRESSPLRPRPGIDTNKGLYGLVEALFFTTTLGILDTSEMRTGRPTNIEAVQMLRDSSQSTVANTETPPSAMSETDSPEASTILKMPPPPTRMVPGTLGGGKFSGWGTTHVLQTEPIQRRSSEPQNKLKLANTAQSLPWNPLMGPRASRSNETWDDYRMTRDAHSDSENTTRTKTRRTKSIISMDTREEFDPADEQSRPS